jgi:hypothetical protein
MSVDDRAAGLLAATAVNRFLHMRLVARGTFTYLVEP